MTKKSYKTVSEYAKREMANAKLNVDILRLHKIFSSITLFDAQREVGVHNLNYFK